MSKTSGSWPRGQLITYQGKAFLTAAAPGCICNGRTLRLFWPDQASQVINYSDLTDPQTNGWSQPLPTNPALTTTLQPNIAAPAGLDTIVFGAGGQIQFSQMSGSTPNPSWPPAEALPPSPIAPATAPAIWSNFAAMQTYCAWGTGGGNNFVYYSLDAGKWWQPPVQAGDATTGGTPAMVQFGPKLYLFAPSPDGVHPIYASTLENGQWSGQTAIVPPGEGTPSGVTACTNSDAIWVFWQSATNSQLRYVVSTDGSSWSDPTSINDYDTTSDTPSASINDQGQIFLTWKANDAGNGLWWSAMTP